MPTAAGKGILHIIIDGYNLIRNVPALAHYEGRSLQDGRDHLIARAAAYRAATGHRVTIVFDGPAPSADSRRGVSICYARPADDDIVRRAGPGCVIVSSDHAVADGARARGADTMRSPEFWELATRHQGVAAPLKRGRPKSTSAAGPYGDGYHKDDEDDDEPPRTDKRGKSKRLSRSAREAEERRRRLRNLM